MKRELGILLLISLAVSILAWAINPGRLPLKADIASYELGINFDLVNAVDAVQMLNDNAVVLVDIRSGEPEIRLPGAFPVRQESFDDDFRDLFDFILPEDKLLLVGNGDLMSLSAIAERISERGYKNLVLMRGGISAWERAGGEVRK
jgi:rhodanese-related sulfurtransferase